MGDEVRMARSVLTPCRSYPWLESRIFHFSKRREGLLSWQSYLLTRESQRCRLKTEHTQNSYRSKKQTLRGLAHKSQYPDPDPTLHGLCLKLPPALTCCPRSAVKSLVLSPSCSPPGCWQDLESQDPASSSPCLPQSLYLHTHLLNRITARSPELSTCWKCGEQFLHLFTIFQLKRNSQPTWWRRQRVSSTLFLSATSLTLCHIPCVCPSSSALLIHRSVLLFFMDPRKPPFVLPELAEINKWVIPPVHK